MERDSVLVIIAVAIVIALLGMTVISLFAYKPLPLPASSAFGQHFTWGDVYVLESISKARYEVLSIYDGNMDSVIGIYTVSRNPDGSFTIDILTYDGTVASNVSAQMRIDSHTYSCMSKYYGARALACAEALEDSKIELAASILPNRFRKTDVLDTVGVESAIYKGDIYQAVRLRRGDVSVWVVKELPLPARIEMHDLSTGQERITIANLKSYE